MKKRLVDFLAAVNRYDTMTAIAQGLYMSQPYVSRQIGEAEKEYGVQLVDRTLPIHLTYAGERLLSYLQQEQQLHRAMDTEMESLGKFEYGSLSLGINQPLAASWFTELLPDFYKRFPQMHVSIQEVTTSRAENMLPDGQLDMFIGKTVYHPRVVTKPLGIMKLALLVPATSRLYRKDRFWRQATAETISRLNGENFIRIGGESRFQELVDHAFRDNGIHVNNRMEVSDSRIAFSLALKQLGAVIVNVNSAKKLSTDLPINVFEFSPEMMSLDFSVAYRKALVPSEPLKFLIQTCVKKADVLMEQGYEL
ncbi:LysR family transcriptional regulator [Furfurilactobacillus rossiae]|uniref:Transcription regulator n=1 Tax=Furfurilactobacillus rossiae DSM 15814 TaxID=1114972 RepID=A0A0R1RI36_9LACO|nr:LysR family transcriptional regulator [Furfurilactobacillus rossiae]KRL53112.1 transcription regulator [Furfurilactobacillus rossiae DSM 15814]QFR67304.1 LysR family transcriptional regulator [Furfurilactobacillus rossiae]QLE60234.1 transcription regulator [Furfurilactobacillus rossiae]